MSTAVAEPEKKVRPKRAFQVLAGSHVVNKIVDYTAEGKPIYGNEHYEGPREVRDESGAIVDRQDGDIIETDEDLVAMFGRNKFREVDLPIRDEFDGMNVSQLKDYAAESDIDLHGKTKREEIVNVIRKTLDYRRAID